MRLLLLLSALFTALSGVAAPCVAAQPVQASATASVAAAAAAVVAARMPRFVVVGYPSTPPTLPLMGRPLALAASHPLYGERRRE